MSLWIGILGGQITVQVSKALVTAPSSQTPYVQGWHFRTDTGFSPRFSGPSPALTYRSNIARLSPTGGGLLVLTDTDKLYSSYTISSAGYGTRVSTFTARYASYGSCFKPSGDAVGLIDQDPAAQANYMTVHAWTDSSGLGTKFANPASPLVIAYAGGDVAFSQNAIAQTNAGPPVLAVWAWSNGFGTKFTNPAVLPAGAAVGGAQGGAPLFSPDGTAFSLTGDGTELFLYSFSSNGFGARYSNANLPSTYTSVLQSWAPSGTAFAMADFANPYIRVYPFSSGSGLGTQYANPSTLPTSSFGVTAAFIPSEDAILGLTYTPELFAYSWSPGSGFGTKYTSAESYTGYITATISTSVSPS